MESRPVLTPIALRHFQTAEAMEARECVYGSSDAISHIAKFPTLAAMIAHQLRANIDATCYKNLEETLNSFTFWKEVKMNVPFYLQGGITDITSINSARIARSNLPAPLPRRIFLSSATLVIVPPHLFTQWQSEIHKHCEDGLRVLTLNSKVNMPDADTLANDFDILLFSSSRKFITFGVIRPILNTFSQASRKKPESQKEKSRPTTSLVDAHLLVSRVFHRASAHFGSLYRIRRS